MADCRAGLYSPRGLVCSSCNHRMFLHATITVCSHRKLKYHHLEWNSVKVLMSFFTGHKQKPIKALRPPPTPAQTQVPHRRADTRGTRWPGGILTGERRWQRRLDGVGRLGKGLDAAGRNMVRERSSAPFICPVPPSPASPQLMPQSACSQASPPPFCSLHVLTLVAAAASHSWWVGTHPSKSYSP